MEHRKLIDFMNAIEKLKCNTRHCYTSTGRQESVAEHSWRAAVMAMLMRDEFQTVDINRVIEMCLIHDIGEAVTGDIPSFYKTAEHEKREEAAVASLIRLLPEDYARDFTGLFQEMKEKKTPEAKLYKAIDNLEAVIAHNESDLSTWIPLEYEKNLTYGETNVAYSEYLTRLKEELNRDSIRKIEREGNSFPVRRVRPDEIQAVLALALRVFEEYEAPSYGETGLAHFKRDCIDNPECIYNIISKEHAAFAAFDRGIPIGMIKDRGNAHISMLFVEGAYHRKGIATALMDQMIEEFKRQGFIRATVNASPYGLPFYIKYGFRPTAEEQRQDGFIFTPMEAMLNLK